MAEPTTLSDLINLYRDHGDMKLESAKQFGDVKEEIAKIGTESIKEGLKSTSDIRMEGVSHTNEIIKENLKSIGSEADRLSGQQSAYYIASQSEANAVARDVAAQKASTDAMFASLVTAVQTTSEKTAAAAALESAKTAQMLALGHAALSKDIYQEGSETRRLLNELKVADLNRQLIERNSELSEHRHEARHWRGNFDQAQYQGLSSQLQALNSQFSETRQGMVNFGTMAGVGQTSTANNVR